ncbi:MAG: hypothetical protein ACE5JJ_00150 [Nitrospinota bacterium]
MEQAGGPPPIILLVEARAALRSAEAEVLRRAGYEVCEAPDAGTAAEVLSRAAVNLVILDACRDPAEVERFLELVRGVRPGAPCILTGLNPRGGSLVRKPCGATVTCLEKPLSRELLLRTVDAALGRCA